MNRRQFTQMAVALAARPALAATEESPAYGEKYRPQFHFSPKKGWTNDPNGLVFYKGEYHLFFQHNPFDTKWGNMTWGHATSTDLVHWVQVANALEPDRLGTMYSGSAVVDEYNTAGFQNGAEKTLVSIYTAAGSSSPESEGQPFTQCIAYSNDRGKTWTKYSGNPVLRHIAGRNRDPKVVWHAPSRKWIMALFLEGNTFRFLSSPDLKTWTKLHDIVVPGCAECPDFFQMTVEGEPGVNKWVWTAANDRYLIGDFDGSRFMPEVMTSEGASGENYYAVQTYSGLPRGRCVQIGWMKGGQYPGMPFNQQMAFPYELKLRRAGGVLKVCSMPVREIESIQHEPRVWSAFELADGENPLRELSGDLWDIQAGFDIGTAAEIGFQVRGRTVVYKVANARSRVLESGNSHAAMPSDSKTVKLRILVDRASIEVFANDGEVIMPSCFIPKDDEHGLKMFATGGRAHVTALKVYKLKSAWKEANA